MSQRLQALRHGHQVDASRRRTSRAARIATVGFAALIVLQASLAAGAPLGDAAWGGSHAELSAGQRLGSAIAVGLYLLAIAVVEGRAAGRVERRYRWGTWIVAGILGASAVLNVASQSPWEKALLAPAAFVLAALCSVVARSAGRSPATCQDDVGVRPAGAQR